MLRAQEDTLTIEMKTLDVIEVSAPVIQVANNREETKREELNAHNAGQNLPYLLQTMPSMVVTSDDGLGIGYAQ